MILEALTNFIPRNVKSINTTMSVCKMTVWLLFLLSHMTDASTTDPPWKNPVYSRMQNITSVIGVDKKTYYVKEGTFDEDILIKKRVFCLIMRISDFSYGDAIAFRKYKTEVTQTRQKDFDLYLIPKKDGGYDVDNFMEVQDEFQEEIANVHLVYSDYSICALFYYDIEDEYELWLYEEPNEVATACELLLALLSDKPRNVYYTSDCNKS
uniref:Putative salivary lipocalin n=1 Tax=Ixodes ricinus TaxID=34613 RepID=A0A0K8RLF7_IXORI